ncbi:hypothetical protein B0H13DRAFT_1856805 [Mycena leptocephala]|nr:hypothetical protein B0H13DRAFT_1856805 [Mycena leptocephala]
MHLFVNIGVKLAWTKRGIGRGKPWRSQIRLATYIPASTCTIFAGVNVSTLLVRLHDPRRRDARQARVLMGTLLGFALSHARCNSPSRIATVLLIPNYKYSDATSRKFIEEYRLGSTVTFTFSEFGIIGVNGDVSNTRAGTCDLLHFSALDKFKPMMRHSHIEWTFLVKVHLEIISRENNRPTTYVQASVITDPFHELITATLLYGAVHTKEGLPTPK